MPENPTESGGESSDNPVESVAFDSTTLSGELANEPSLRNFDTVDKLANSYVHAVKKMGAPPESFLKIPQEGESWEEIHGLLGRPSEPDGYQFEDFGDDNDGELDGFREWAHNLGFTNDQALGVLSELNDQAVSSREQETVDYERQQQEGVEALRREWPKETYDEELDFSRRGFSQFATKEDLEFMDSSGLGNHPNVIKLFNRIGKAMSEAGVVVGQSSQLGDLTPQSAQEKINELYNDKEFLKSYRDEQDPQHKAASKRMSRLFKTAYPST